jgi:hypothetical protein
VRVVAQAGINQALAKFTAGHDTKPSLPAPPQVATNKPGGKPGKKGGHSEDAPPPPHAPSGPPPEKYKSDDGERVYVGQMTVEISEPKRPKQHQKGRIEVISTRTRKHHFTIKMGQCTLPFHRPPGETRRVYDLDASTPCDTDAIEMKLTKGRLELDTDHDKLKLSVEGTASTKCKKASCKVESGAISYQLAADRR